MIEQNILLALLVTYVSTQDTSTSQGSQSPYLPDQSSWSSVTGLFSENTNNHMSMPREMEVSLRGTQCLILLVIMTTWDHSVYGT